MIAEKVMQANDINDWVASFMPGTTKWNNIVAAIQNSVYYHQYYTALPYQIPHTVANILKKQDFRVVEIEIEVARPMKHIVKHTVLLWT